MVGAVARSREVVQAVVNAVAVSVAALTVVAVIGCERSKQDVVDMSGAFQRCIQTLPREKSC
jgi:hypothetical protein